MATPQPEFAVEQEDEQPPRRLQRIPTPFVWAPVSAAPIRVALLGASTRRLTDTLETLQASGHDVVCYDSVEPLLDELQSLTHPLEVVVIDGDERPRVAASALERLRTQEGGLPIVLIAADDPELLADADVWAVEEVLESPVHPVALRAAVAAAATCSERDLVVDWLAASA